MQPGEERSVGNKTECPDLVYSPSAASAGLLRGMPRIGRPISLVSKLSGEMSAEQGKTCPLLPGGHGYSSFDIELKIVSTKARIRTARGKGA